MAAVAAAAVLAAVHLAAARLALLDLLPRSVWLSAAGGISVAYVFVHLLPELGEEQATLEESARGALPYLEHHAYLVALVGLALFYAVERGGEHDARRTFGVAVASFALKNAIIGYLLVHRGGESRTDLALFTGAMALHFVVNDVGLRRRYEELYRSVGRFVLAAAPLAGVALAHAYELSEAAIALLLAFLAGGVVLNVLKEELPAERESRFWAFAAGAAAYAALLLAL